MEKGHRGTYTACHVLASKNVEEIMGLFLDLEQDQLLHKQPHFYLNIGFLVYRGGPCREFAKKRLVGKQTKLIDSSAH